MGDRARVTMYTTQYCPYCMMARSLLNDKGVDFEDIAVDGNLELREHMRQLSGRNSVPQIFIGDRPIGGFDELYAMEKAGRLDELLAEAPQEDHEDDQ